MKIHCFPDWLVLGLFAAAFPMPGLRAQFYAPETAFHDVCQRHFAVEAARVVACLDRARGSSVTQVTYELTSTGTNGNEWRIRWMGADRKELRVASVRYPHATLKSGPYFYRDVFRQLCGASNLIDGVRINPAHVEAAFWDGAAQAGLSRMECLESAFKFWNVPEGKQPTVEQASRLAGLLAQAPTHGFWQGSALDGVLLARAAAWLCAVEQCTTPNDNLWAPILFIAGRENHAKRSWKPGTNSPVVVWWDALITEIPADKAILLSAAPQQRSRAMPMIAWQTLVSQGYHDAAGNLASMLYGRRGNEMSRLYDYAPTFSDGSIENGHIMNGSWASLSRAAWIRTLRAYPATSLDFRGYEDALKKAEASTRRSQGLLASLFNAAVPSSDPSITGLDAAAPLLRIAYENSTGPLTPVAHVTSRDLLHYGWENTVLQMQARHYFVGTKWSVPELAASIRQAATSNIPHFALLQSTNASAAKADVLNRLQYVNWTFGRHWPAAGIRHSTALTNDIGPLSRHWLRPSMSGWLYNCWLWAHSPEERDPLIASIVEEGGRAMNFRMLDFFTYNCESANELRTFAHITNGLSFATSLLWDYFERTRSGDPTIVPTPERCREAEAMFWGNPNSDMGPLVFRMYLLAGEFPAAKKFYDEAMKLPYDAVSYSFRMDSPRWTLAMLEKNRQDMERVVKENETYSGSDFLVRINDALYQENYPLAEQIAREGIERYGAGKPGAPSSLEIVRRVLTLREALAKPDHPGHAHAIGYLVHVTKLSVTQWILIQNLKLSTADAITFLGGDNAKGLRKLIILYLRKDVDGFDKLLAHPDANWSTNEAALAGWLRAELRKISPTLKPDNMRPANSDPIEARVAAVL